MYSNPENQKLFREALQTYSEMGFKALPVIVYEKPDKDGVMKREKFPLVRWEEFQKRFPTKKELSEWSENPWSNFAGVLLVTGLFATDPDRYLCVVDFDQRSGKPDYTEFIDELSGAMRTRTSSGGYHFYFQSPLNLKNAVNIYSRDKGSEDTITDFRGQGGVIVAGPTPLLSQNPLDPSLNQGDLRILSRYETDLIDRPENLIPLPQTFISALEAKRQVDSGKWKELFSNEKLMKGDHHKFAMSLAGKLLLDVKDEHEVYAARFLFANIMRQKESKPFPEKDADRMFAYCLSQGEKKRSPEFRNAVELSKKTLREEKAKQTLDNARLDWSNLQVERLEVLGDVILAFNSNGESMQFSAEDYFNQKKFRSNHLLYFGQELKIISQFAFESLIASIPTKRNRDSTASLTELVLSILESWIEEDEAFEDEADAKRTAKVHSHSKSVSPLDSAKIKLWFKLSQLIDTIKEEGLVPKRTSVIATLKDIGSSLDRNNQCNLWTYEPNK